MQRNPAALATEEFDVLIIGAGAFGAAAARDAALRGLRTALIERADFGGGIPYFSFPSNSNRRRACIRTLSMNRPMSSRRVGRARARR